MFHHTRHLFRLLMFAGLVALVAAGTASAQVLEHGGTASDARAEAIPGLIDLTAALPYAASTPWAPALVSCDITSCMLQCEAEGQACMAECDLLPIGGGRTRCRLACQREAATCQDYCFAFCNV